jgi:hypothetical protein
MLVDAYRRRAETYWLWIIFGVPGGSLAYFFLVKIRDREMQALQRKLLASFEKPPSPALLRRRWESPGVANRLALARVSRTPATSGASSFQALLAHRPGDFERSTASALRAELGVTAAETTLDSDRRRRHRDFAAWQALAKRLCAWAGRRKPRLVRDLVQRAPPWPSGAAGPSPRAPSARAKRTTCSLALCATDSLRGAYAAQIALRAGAALTPESERRQAHEKSGSSTQAPGEQCSRCSLYAAPAAGPSSTAWAMCRGKTLRPPAVAAPAAVVAPAAPARVAASIRAAWLESRGLVGHSAAPRCNALPASPACRSSQASARWASAPETAR